MTPASPGIKAGIRQALSLIAILAMALSPAMACAEEIRVATASNFRTAMSQLAGKFEKKSGHSVIPVFGSTGKHYAQIINGAPFDAFFAADVRRPELLEQNGISVPGSRFTYAMGKLVLWSPRANYVDVGGNVLKRGEFRYLALANPELAPYGAAARDVLEALGLWNGLSQRMVLGENVGQAFLFVRSGNAELGFVAASQLVGSNPVPMEGSLWEVPENLYRPIGQQAVLLSDTRASRAFMAYIRSEEAARIIHENGYTNPVHAEP